MKFIYKVVFFVSGVSIPYNLPSKQQLKQADLILQKEIFDTIHSICERQYPNLVRFPDLISFDNLKALYLYLEKKGIT